MKISMELIDNIGIDAMFYERLLGNIDQCNLGNYHCRISEGHRGI